MLGLKLIEVSKEAYEQNDFPRQMVFFTEIVTTILCDKKLLSPIV